jgi:uncharacterized membrane protein YphA (DoxX/SURF4 family)
MSHLHQTTSSSRTLRGALWAVQALLAAGFGMAGLMKMTQPIAELARMMIWPGDVPAALVRLIGVLDFAGAIGLILPAATRIRPALTPIAAAALVALMAGASVFHLSRGEAQMLPATLLLGALAAFVAWGRGRKARIVAR